MEELMQEFIKQQKKTNRIHTIMLIVCMAACVGVFLVVAYVSSVLVPILNDVSKSVETLTTTLETNLASLQVISDSIVNQNVVGGLAEGIEKIQGIDIDTLNSAIKDLQDVVAPLAKTVNFFR